MLTQYEKLVDEMNSRIFWREFLRCGELCYRLQSIPQPVIELNDCQRLLMMAQLEVEGVQDGGVVML